MFKVIPVFLYALGDQPLSNENMEELRNLKETYPYNPILFVSSLSHITFDSFDGSELTKSEQRRQQSRVVDSSESTSSTKDDSLMSSSTQDDSLKSSGRLDSVKESDEGLNLDKINSLGITWLDQLTDLGFMGETVDVDQNSWFANGQFSHSSDLLDVTKLGKNFFIAFIHIFINIYNNALLSCDSSNNSFCIFIT